MIRNGESRYVRLQYGIQSIDNLTFITLISSDYHGTLGVSYYTSKTLNKHIHPKIYERQLTNWHSDITIEITLNYYFLDLHQI
jgi:hypothetical protein